MREVLRLKNVEKSLHADKVLRNVNLQIFAGELVGLFGLQMTGKTALTRILEGQEKPDAGKLYLDEKPVEFQNSFAARQAGIYSLSVKGLLVGNMTAAENLYVLNHAPTPAPLPAKELSARASFTFRQFGLHIRPETKGKCLTRTEQAVLCLIRIAMQEPRLIIIDSGIEYELEDYQTFQRMVLHLRSVGISFLVVGNKASSLAACCDRIYTIREGTLSGALYRRDMEPQTLSRILTGGEAVLPAPAPPERCGPPLLELSDLCLQEGGTALNFVLYPGEVCALIPPQQTSVEELGYTLFGLRRPASGHYYMEGRRADFRSPREAIRHGVALVSNDREAALFQGFDLKGNLLFPYIAAGNSLHLIRNKFSRVAAEALRESYGIQEQSTARWGGGKNLRISSLHRISIARWEPLSPKLYIFINPFSVLDEKSSGELRSLFARLAGNGRSVLLLAPNVYGVKDACTRLERF